MTTNGEWLFSKPFDEQVAWMNAEHQDGTLDGDTAALNAKIAELERKLRISWEYECKFQDERDVLQAQVDELTAKLERCENRLGFYRSKLGTCADLSEEIRNVAMGITDEGMA